MKQTWEEMRNSLSWPTPYPPYYLLSVKIPPVKRDSDMYIYEFNFYDKSGTPVLQVGREASSLVEAIQTFVMPEDDVLYTANAVRVEVIQSVKVGE